MGGPGSGPRKGGGGGKTRGRFPKKEGEGKGLRGLDVKSYKFTKNITFQKQGSLTKVGYKHGSGTKGHPSIISRRGKRL
jgi:hypothetical protein